MTILNIYYYPGGNGSCTSMIYPFNRIVQNYFEISFGIDGSYGLRNISKFMGNK